MRTRLLTKVRRMSAVGVALTAGTAASAATAIYPNPRPVKGFASTHDPSMIRLADGSYEVFATHYGVEIYASPCWRDGWPVVAP